MWQHFLFTACLQVLSKKKLQDLVREIDPNEQLDEDVEEVGLKKMILMSQQDYS